MFTEITEIGGGLRAAGMVHFEQWRGRKYSEVPTWKEYLAKVLDRVGGFFYGTILNVWVGRMVACATFKLRHRKILQMGWLVDQWDVHNIVTNEGLEYALGVSLDGTTTQITAWYLALKDETGDPVDGSETYASPVFTELATYDEATRPAWTPGSITGTTTKSIDNSSSAAVFTISATDDYYGVALVGGGTGASTKSDTAGGGTMFSVANFATPKSLIDNDTLTVTYTFTATDAG